MCLFRLEERRSVFVATLIRVSEETLFRKFLADRHQAMPEANHHCWAYNFGPPGDSARIGLSDDGEPHGTAGRPIWTVIQHAHFGEVAIVVSRVFGGVKLGTGGLVKAYTAAAKGVLGSLVPVFHEPRKHLVFRLPYREQASILHWLKQEGGEIHRTDYDDGVTLHVSVPRKSELRTKAFLAGRDVTVVDQIH
jgi:uncharacterized YigZ family protein